MSVLDQARRDESGVLFFEHAADYSKPTPENFLAGDQIFLKGITLGVEIAEFFQNLCLFLFLS